MHTLGYEVVATVSQRRERLSAGTVVGTGKLQELARLTGGALVPDGVFVPWEGGVRFEPLPPPTQALISTDQEQGVVVRIPEPATLLPGSMALGAARSPEAAYRAAVISGRELRAMGVNQDLAPVADVNMNALNPVIGVRSFSENPALVSELVLAQVHGYQQEGVAATAKHFPGHGDTNVDSHTRALRSGRAARPSCSASGLGGGGRERGSLLGWGWEVPARHEG